MEDNNSLGNGTPENVPANGVDNAEKTFTRDELNKIVASEKAKAMEDYKKQLEAEKSEAEKLANMKAEEKLKYELEKEQKKSSDAVAELEAYKLKDTALGIAKEKNIPVGLLDFIEFKGNNAENVSSKLEQLNKLFSNEVQKALEDKLKQQSPRNVLNTTISSDKAYLDNKYKNNPWYKG